MKKGRRIVTLALTACLAAVSLAACAGPGDGPVTPGGSTEKRGTINISFPMGDEKYAWQAVADAYMEMHQGVNVVVEDKEMATYTDWLTSQLASTDISVDIVQNNSVAQYFGENKFIDFLQYMGNENPYSESGTELWMDMLQPAAYRSNGPQQEAFCLNVDSTQLQWFYNKDIFEEVGVEPPQDWDELVEVCEKIDAAGYTPLAVGGNAEAFWLMDFGWIIRVYTDQYFRDIEPEVQAQEGDWCYDPDTADWVYDPTDYENDLDTNYTKNPLRVVKGIQEGKYGPNTAKYKDMLNNLLRIFPRYNVEGFTGMSVGDAKVHFWTGAAAMIVSLGDFYTLYEGAMATVDPEDRINYGSFASPPMTGDLVAVDTTRSLGGPQGFIGAINKSQEQNDLVVDFLMYYASPQGQQVRLAAMEEIGMIPKGSLLVKNVEFPEAFKFLEEIEYRGECDLNPANMFARGLDDEQTTVRAFQVNMQNLMLGGFESVDAYAEKMQQDLITGIPAWLRKMGYREDALNDVTKDPF